MAVHIHLPGIKTDVLASCAPITCPWIGTVYQNINLFILFDDSLYGLTN